MEHVAVGHAPPDELGVGRCDVVDHEVQALDRAGVSFENVPIEIEHAKPDGVVCTTRQSPARWSTPSTNRS
jgi:hypothetical protein